MVKSVIFFGASRGCGHHAALKLLSGPDPPQCTFLLRKPDALLKSTGFEGLGADVRESKVHIVTGDATDQAKVDEAIKLADKLGGGKIDTVVYSIGPSRLGRAVVPSLTENVKAARPSTYPRSRSGSTTPTSPSRRSPPSSVRCMPSPRPLPFPPASLSSPQTA